MIRTGEQAGTQYLRTFQGHLVSFEGFMAHGWIGTDLVMVWAIDGDGNPVEFQFVQLSPPGLPMRRIGIKNGDFHTIVTSGLDLLQYRKKGCIDLSSPKQQIHSDLVGHGKLLCGRQIN